MPTEVPVADTLDLKQLLGVLTAVKKGDFSARMPLDLTGISGKICDALNDIIETNDKLCGEMSRISTVVGKEGKTAQRASNVGQGGAWNACIDSVNTLIVDLVQPTTEVARVIGAVANGDLGQTMALEIDGRPLTGEFLRTAKTVNTMVDQLSAFASEVTRVAREVGTDGKLGGQAQVKGVAGTWKDLTDNVNYMAGNLTSQVRNIAEVTTAVANGDLSKKITVEVRGEILDLKNTINIMVDQLNSFASEVTRVAREVGTDGKLGGQADVRGVSGTWKDLTDNVNSMASNLTSQVRNIAEVTTAVANGDLSKKITVEVRGEILDLKNTINIMVDQLNGFASEVSRVAREVGTDGKLGGQADVKGVSGTWKDLTDNVNFMASNLTGQVRNIADVATAIANGDLSKKITVDVRGEILDLKNTINIMVDQLNSFASEVTRVAREVGTEGNLGGQAEVKGVSGTWKDLTDNVNFMASNLTGQVRNIAEVTTAVANGDLSKKITADARGEILELKDTINTMVDQLNGFASEVTRVAREVGTEGKLGGQADIRGVAGTWKDLTDSVNSMAGNLTSQVRNIAEVTTAVANGDLSKKITVEVRGEILDLKNTINIMVDQLNSFASEVTRVAREVGTEGKLGAQAVVRGVSGTWKDLTDNVNYMASNLTGQVRNIADVTTAVANGDLSKKITVDVRGEILELKNTINTMVDQLNSFASEVTRVAREVGTDGKLGAQADIRGVAGTWKDLTDNVNFMASNLTGQVRGIAGVTTAVANGDLTKKITVEAKGEILDLKNTINTMVDQLNAFASEVTRVAREVGTDGKLGGQADVKGVAGTWKDLTDNVNYMAANLTNQVRGIARVVTAVANGNLKQKLVLEAKGEIAELADTINAMIDTLATFAEQVTTVAREVGSEGRLGGQASVPGAAGTWRDLTDNVNQLATTLTTQIRAIAEVATAVTTGDLSRSIAVEAAGEVATLKDNINEMIRNLRDTTRINEEQDWLKTNVARFTRLLQGQRDLLNVSQLILSELAPLVTEQAGVFYFNDSSTSNGSNGNGANGNGGNSNDGNGGRSAYDLTSNYNGNGATLKLLASYGYQQRKSLSNRFAPGEGLVGQCMLEKQRILLMDVPDDYIRISSGLGDAPPRNIVVLPILFEGEVLAVLELASFNRFTDIQLTFLDQLAESIGIVLNTLAAGMRTEELLKQSQSLTQELQNQQQELQETNRRLEQQAKTLQASEDLLRQQQEELQQTNEELEEKAQLPSEQNHEVERKNRQIELARQELEEKAEQLSLTSKYKSEFLANMSHELRTPLNSMLILSRLLSENNDNNLTVKQVEYATTIHSSGNDLLALINEILDLAKIESGTLEVDPSDVAFIGLQDYVERNFREVAQDKGLEFKVQLADGLPANIRTDSQRLQQVLRNLLSNALKFTEQGSVTLEMRVATDGWSRDQDNLNRAGRVIAFAVSDTGIGIPAHRQRMVFEAFQQADGTTSRKYGGTGLGLSISREIANLLGGEIKLVSSPGEGSTFTLYLPQTPPNRQARIESELSSRGAITRGRSGAVGGASGTGGGGAGTSEAGDTDIGGGSGNPPPASGATSTVAETDGETTAIMPAESRLLVAGDVGDDRSDIQTDDQVLMIVEDDPTFAQILLERARDKGFKGIIASNGGMVAPLARQFRPDAITLDIGLPDMDGWAVLDRLKHDAETRHIPVHIISGFEEKQRGLRQGAIAYMQKPVTRESLDDALTDIKGFVERKVKRLLIVEDDDTQRNSIVELIGNGDVKTSAVKTGGEALEMLRGETFDCMVLDLGLPDMTGFQLIEQIRKDPALTHIPIVIYTGKELTKKQDTELRRLADTIIVKDARSPERLLDETTLFLHRVQANLPTSKRQMLDQVRLDDPVLSGKKVLVVDDDIRNIFALTSLLERHKMQVLYAENGKDGIETLQNTAGIDIVLMDVMMPTMDGYETMRAIRALSKFKTLPIIALTAKAMKGDRETCIEAGASDYISKPVDTEQLLSLLRVWLYR